MFGLLVVGLFLALGLAVILGWTADSRDDEHKLWPLKPATAEVPPRPL